MAKNYRMRFTNSCRYVHNIMYHSGLIIGAGLIMIYLKIAILKKRVCSYVLASIVNWQIFT